MDRSQYWARLCLLLTPLMMGLIRRSSTILLVATTAVTLVQHRKNIASQWRSASFDKLLVIGILLLTAWAATTLAWSALPARGFKQLFFDFLLPVLCGFWLLTLPNGQNHVQSTRWFALGLTAAAIIVTIQLYTQFRIEAAFSSLDELHIRSRFNMALVTYALFLPTLFSILKYNHLTTSAALAAILCTTMISHSASAKLALFVGATIYILASVIPRKISLSIFGVILFSVLFIQPWQGELVNQAFEQTGQYELLFESAKERITIWKASGIVTLNALPWGSGMGSSDAVSETVFAKGMDAHLKTGLYQTHAHNVFLNVWMELGIPGLIGMIIISIGILRSLARVPNTSYAASMALASQIVVVSLVSHGAWQAWWFTAIMLGILALKQYAPQTTSKP